MTRRVDGRAEDVDARGVRRSERRPSEILDAMVSEVAGVLGGNLAGLYLDVCRHSARSRKRPPGWALTRRRDPLRAAASGRDQDG